MEKREKFFLFLLIFLVLAIIVLLIFNLFFLKPEVGINFPFLGEKKDSLVLPVEKKFFNKSEIVQLELGKNSLAFRLPPETPFYAAMDGKVEITGSFPQQIINLTSLDGNSRLLYLFAGKAVVENMSSVKKGDVLGKASGENLPTRDVNLIVQYFAYGNQINVSKELVKDFVK